MMSLESAIKHYSELAEENEKDAEQFKRIKATQDMISHCYECAEEHRQLAEWLRELKGYREGFDKVLGDISQYIENAYEHETPYDNGRHDGAIDCYGRIIAEFEEVNTDENSD